MKLPPEKDLYSILGVNPEASLEDIREAYLARTRVIHPDRFDQQRQPKEWEKANEMLAELNEAYSILQNTNSRAQYDEFRSGRYRRQAEPSHERYHEPEPPPQSPFEFGELTSGKAVFKNLPKKVQDRLLNRQLNHEIDQIQIKLSSVLWNYVFLTILLCWFWYLFANFGSDKWDIITILFNGFITLLVAVLIGRNIITICRWQLSNLKQYFYITPIYFIKTKFDMVSFWPIWSLKDISVTHNYKNDSYQESKIVLKFDNYNESFTLPSKKDVETLMDRIRSYDALLRAAYMSNNYQYFTNNDDFFRVPRSAIPTYALLSKGKQLFIYAASVLVCAASLFGAISANEQLTRKQWIRHDMPTEYTPETSPQRVSKPSYPEQELPYSGSVLTFTADERIAPFEIKAAEGSHYLLKLVNISDNTPVLTVFVQSGSTVNIDVPLGAYELRYASGETWYGYEYLFGPGTSYSKADKTFNFEIVGNKVNGFTITLYQVANGNLQTSIINPTEF